MKEGRNMTTLTFNAFSSASPERELVVADRCDRCGAQAFMQAIKGGSDILFCGHHGKFHREALEDQGWVVLDSTYKLNEKPSPSNADI
jgi:hypothetical protein